MPRKKLVYLIKEDSKMTSLREWCERNKLNYNTISARLTRSGLHDNLEGIIIISPISFKYRKIMSAGLQKVGRKSNDRKKV